MVESSDEDDSSGNKLIVEGKRRRVAVDYKALNQEMFGDEETPEVAELLGAIEEEEEEEDEGWSPRAQAKKARMERLKRKKEEEEEESASDADSDDAEEESGEQEEKEDVGNAGVKEDEAQKEEGIAE